MTPMRLSIPRDYQEPKRAAKLSACCHTLIVMDVRYHATASCPEEWDERCSACGAWEPGEAEEAIHDRS